MTTRKLFFLLWIAGGVLPACQREPSGDKGETRDSSDSGQAETGESGETKDSTETGHVDTDDTGPPLLNISELARLTVYGEERWGHLGWPLVLGDISGDGIDDLCFMEWKLSRCVGFRSPVPEGVFVAGEADFAAEVYVNFSAPGDLNGDGIDDLATWNRVILGPVEDYEGYVDAEITYLYQDYYNPNPVQVNQGDSNGDGIDDFILELYWTDWKTGTGSYDKYLYSGIDSPVIESDAYLSQIIDRTAVTEVGFMGDTNGDGFDDFGYSCGSLALGPVPALVSSPEIEFLGSWSGLRAAGDVNGDGYDDVASQGYVLGDDAEGVQVYVGPFKDVVRWDHAVAGMFHEEWAERDELLGISSTGDQNGDSLPDLAFISTDAANILNGVWLWETPFEGVHTSDDATLVLKSPESSIRGAFMDGHGDFTGDGSSDDFLVGDHHYDAFASEGGVGWVMIGGTLY